MSVAAAPLIAAAGILSSCSSREAADGGPAVSRDYQVAAFNSIEVAGPYDVEVRTGSGQTIAGKGPQRLIEQTVVEVKGDTLTIRPEQSRGWFHSGWHSSGKANFVITVPELRGATIAGSGDIKVDRLSGNGFEGSIAGSGELDLGSIDIQTLKLAIAGSGGVKAGNGTAKVAEYEIAGSGGINAGGISAEQAKVSIAGSGSVQAKATQTAKIDIMGSGSVNMTGGAKCEVSKMGSGNVHCS
jgi:hypothetical protein